MKIKHVLLTALFSALGLGAYAQDTEHNWFIQGQLGASYSLGDADFGKLVSPAGAISVGKYFNPTIGARLSISGWRGRGGNGEGRPAYGFYYGAATVDGLLNLSTLFAGKNPDRLFNASLIAGIGYNNRFDPNSGSFMARLGLQGSIRLNDAFAFNIEALANRVRWHWERVGDLGADGKLMMSFHSIPQASSDRGDPYEVQCKQTAEKLRRALGLKSEQVVQVFQSKFGRAKWLEPFAVDTAPVLGRSGLKRLDVICPGFAADCLETLEEIATELRSIYEEAGGTGFHYISCLNAEDDAVELYAALVKKALERA